MNIKPKKLKNGEKVAIVSLSRGLLGMPFCKHELNIALKRLKDYGLIPVIMNNSLKDMDYLQEHPEDRAADLKQAFMDKEIKGIICAIGGDDTYKTFKYLMEDEEFRDAVRNNPKIFTGFSDTTNNHLMLNKLGLSTFYGPCLLVDLAELDREMLPYTKKYFEMFMGDGNPFEITSSEYWYSDRENYGPEMIGVPRMEHREEHGYEVLNGCGIRKGRLYGGCIESIYDALTGFTYPDEKDVYEKYSILPTSDEWQEKILFLETSDTRTEPAKFKKMLNELKSRNILSLVQGIIVGKPIDEKYYEEYKEVYKEVFKDIETPVLYNMNFGHSVPKCILPYDAEVTVDYDNKKVFVVSNIFEN